MNPKYSILFCNQALNDYIEQIRQWLKTGVKVFWFGQNKDVEYLRQEFPDYSEAFFLQCYEASLTDQAIVIDGGESDKLIQALEKDCPAFNAAQFRVEHCQADEHIIVEASAGTGKTTVMIDRILFLLHTVPDLKPAEIYMITFTNDATNQMNARLQQILLKKYQLTGNIRYLHWMEEQSQMHISTIHSFAYMLLKEYGIEAGFSKGLQLHTMNYERKELIKNILDDYTNPGTSVRSQLGLSFYQCNATLDKYWRKFAQLGYSRDNIMHMDWGSGVSKDSANFQDAALSVFSQLDNNYLDVKRKNNAISLNDIMRDLDLVLKSADKSLSDLSIRYLFVDEFQDSDNSQIKVLCWLVKNLGIQLFVVGDVKQSIYRFRGANETAFSTLQDQLQDIHAKKPVFYSLVNNYRTSANVLDEMNQYFEAWAAADYLDYKDSVRPINSTPGKINMVACAGQASLESQFCNIAKDALKNRDKRLSMANRPVKESDRVVVLCRSNRQLEAIAAICENNHIPAIVKREGSFFISDAVRDFYAVIASYVFSYEPKYLFNYLVSPYSGIHNSIDLNALEACDGDKEALMSKLEPYMNQTNWSNYYKAFRLSPVMSVIKHMLEREDIVYRYLSKLRNRYESMMEYIF